MHFSERDSTTTRWPCVGPDAIRRRRLVGALRNVAMIGERAVYAGSTYRASELSRAGVSGAVRAVARVDVAKIIDGIYVVVRRSLF